MAFLRAIFLLMLLTSGAFFVHFLATGQQRYKLLGLRVLRWTVVAALICFGVLALENLTEHPTRPERFAVHTARPILGGISAIATPGFAAYYWLQTKKTGLMLPAHRKSAMTHRQSLVAGFFLSGFCSGVVAAEKPSVPYFCRGRVDSLPLNCCKEMMRKASAVSAH